jgi:hypothetical protein
LRKERDDRVEFKLEHIRNEQAFKDEQVVFAGKPLANGTGA